jgi:hypothetical protein
VFEIAVAADVAFDLAETDGDGAEGLGGFAECEPACDSGGS